MKAYNSLKKLLISNFKTNFKTFIIILFFSCSSGKKEQAATIPCEKVGDISKYFIEKDTTELIERKEYCSVKITTFCGEDGAGYVWGDLFVKENVYYVRLIEPESFIFKLFDFNLDIEESITVKWRLKKLKYKRDTLLSQKEYKMLLEAKFYSRHYLDTIFKYRFLDFGYSWNEDDVCYFVSKKKGILGVYHCDIEENENGELQEYIFYRSGDIFLETLDYTKANFGYVIE